MSNDWLKARIESTKTLIEQYETAILAVSTTGVQSFSFDTGQTRKVVTKMNLTETRNALNAAYSLLFDLEARVYGQTVTARPCW